MSATSSASALDVIRACASSINLGGLGTAETGRRHRRGRRADRAPAARCHQRRASLPSGHRPGRRPRPGDRSPGTRRSAHPRRHDARIERHRGLRPRARGEGDPRHAGAVRDHGEPRLRAAVQGPQDRRRDREAVRPQPAPGEGAQALPALSPAASRRCDAMVTTEIAVATRKQGRANFATAADHAAERAIVARLTAGYPDIPVLAEESATKALRKAERLWVVDPIDGTLNFSRGIPFYAVVIAYVEDGRSRAAAVHSPRTRETFIASEGAGATLGRTRIQVSDTRRLSQALAT